MLGLMKPEEKLVSMAIAHGAWNLGKVKDSLVKSGGSGKRHTVRYVPTSQVIIT